MKVLVTGASGRLGPYVVADLEVAGHELVLWSEFLWSWVGSEDVVSAHRLLMEQADRIEPHGVYFCTADDTGLLEPTRECLARFRPELLPLAG